MGRRGRIRSCTSHHPGLVSSNSDPELCNCPRDPTKEYRSNLHCQRVYGNTRDFWGLAVQEKRYRKEIRLPQD